MWTHMRNSLTECLLDFLGKCIGEEAKYEGVRLLFDGLQQPVLNKQVHKDTHTASEPHWVFQHVSTC